MRLLKTSQVNVSIAVSGN